MDFPLFVLWISFAVTSAASRDLLWTKDSFHVPSLCSHPFNLTSCRWTSHLLQPWPSPWPVCPQPHPWPCINCSLSLLCTPVPASDKLNLKFLLLSAALLAATIPAGYFTFPCCLSCTVEVGDAFGAGKVGVRNQPSLSAPCTTRSQPKHHPESHRSFTKGCFIFFWPFLRWNLFLSVPCPWGWVLGPEIRCSGHLGFQTRSWCFDGRVWDTSCET